MVGWHYWPNGHEFEQDSGVGDGQGSLGCCSPCGCKESDMTERLNWTAVRINYIKCKLRHKIILRRTLDRKNLNIRLKKKEMYFFE